MAFAVSALVILPQSCYMRLKRRANFAGRPFCYEKAETGGKRKTLTDRAIGSLGRSQGRSRA
jgi:hypothetical protein